MHFLAHSFIITLLFYSYDGRDCSKPEYYWAPYTGKVPPDAFAVDDETTGGPSYIGMTSPSSKGAWLVPIQLKEGAKSVTFAFSRKEGVKEVDTFMHILCVFEGHKLQWTNVKRYYPEEVKNRCCLVEAGVGKFKDNDRPKSLFIGRKNANGTVYIGRVYNYKPWQGVYYMAGRKPSTSKDDFDILSYDCDD